MTDGIGNALIKAERRRQIEVEGWTAEHDDAHEELVLENAAYNYWMAQDEKADPIIEGEPSWPWDIAWWKPKDRLRNLVRAGALYLAGSERALRHNQLDLQVSDSLHVVTIGDELDTYLRGRSIAHRVGMNPYGEQLWPEGLVAWQEARPPSLTGDNDENSTGRLRACAYCGSLHPGDLAAAIRLGARGEWADRKYGWPHKAYFEGIPNPHAGLLESRAASSHPDPRYPRQVQHGFDPATGAPAYMWHEEGRPATALTGGKFYSVHLQDALPQDRALIERHLGTKFQFSPDGQQVGWEPWEPQSRTLVNKLSDRRNSA